VDCWPSWYYYMPSVSLVTAGYRQSIHTCHSPLVTGYCQAEYVRVKQFFSDLSHTTPYHSYMQSIHTCRSSPLSDGWLPHHTCSIGRVYIHATVSIDLLLLAEYTYMPSSPLVTVGYKAACIVSSGP
jgi:hypothetical protein